MTGVQTCALPILKALDDEEFNIDLIGFDDQELARLLAEPDAVHGRTDEDAIPEVPESPVSVRGDLLRLGDHTLLVGDATLREEVDRLMAGDRADLVLTDPPTMLGTKVIRRIGSPFRATG